MDASWPRWILSAVRFAGVLTLLLWAAVPRPNIPHTVQRLACTITVHETIDLYGSLATPANAAAVESAIEQCWNGHRSNWCPVFFDITMRTYPNASTFLGTGDGGWNIKLIAPPYRSNVHQIFGWGAWEVSSPVPTPGDLWTFCHEAGHIFGLPDDYTDKWGIPNLSTLTWPVTSVPNPGHAGHMMASFNGALTQHEIDDILKNSEVTCPDGCCEALR